jgi:hypothetical protein
VYISDNDKILIGDIKLRSQNKEYPQSPSDISTYTGKQGRSRFPKSKLRARKTATKELEKLKPCDKGKHQ